MAVKGSPWRQGRQAFVAIHYSMEPSRRWNMTDMRQPYPLEIAVQIRNSGKLEKASTYHRRITPVLPHLGADEEGALSANPIPPAPGLVMESWERIVDDLHELLSDVDMVITHGEGRLVESMRQLNATSMNHARLNAERFCTDELSRRAALKRLPKDRWGHFLVHEAAEEAGVPLAPKDAGAMRVVKLTRYLFDWAHKEMDGMSFESPVLSSDGKITLGPFPMCTPQVEGFRFEPYQGPAIAKSLAHAERGRGGVIVSPTGSGKTVMAASRNASLAKAKNGGKVLVITESPKILRQMQVAYGVLYPELNVTRCFSGERDMSGDIVLASRQQLAVIGDDISKEGFAFVDIDEAHHAASGQYADILKALKNRNKKLLVFGETATPQRADRKSLKKVFGQVTSMIRLQEVRQTGRIVNLRLLRDGQIAEKDIAEVNRIQDSKELPDKGELSEVLNTEENNNLLVRLFCDYASDRLTVVYCVDIDHAEGVYAAFRDAGVEACVIHSRDGRTREQQDEVLDEFEAGKIRVMINVQSLTEGWDCPPASCAIIARPANHVSSLEQMVGRVLRAAPGKEDALLVDVGVNQDALNQMLFRLTDETLEVRGVTEEHDKRKPREAAEDAESAYQPPEAWVPPLLPIGGGWLGVSLGGRLLGCIAQDDGWLALEMRDPVTHGKPQLEDIPELSEVGEWLGGVWRRYRRGTEARGAWRRSRLHQRWWKRMYDRFRHIPREPERGAVYEALDAIRQDPAYHREFGVRYVRHQNAGALLRWVSDAWLPEADPYGFERETMVTDLRSPPLKGATRTVYHRYHERLLEAGSRVRGRLVRGLKQSGIVAWQAPEELASRQGALDLAMGDD